MNSDASLKIFRFLAGFAGVYHCILGLLGTFASAEFIAKTVSTVYGVAPRVDLQFLSSARFASAYLLAFGVMMLLVAWKPREHHMFVWAAVVLFAIRVFDRLVYFNVLQDAYGITMAQNLRVLIPVAIILVGLIVFRPKTQQ